ncbi:hypothetical protein ABIA39_007024 [Nocardia sp. GAS34]|uniref:hypothetical protein n=1 Tax=unclassified Nocardia TaxID=2637762 RepID=UPI003D1E8B41
MTAPDSALDSRPRRIVALTAVCYVVFFVVSLVLQFRMNGHASIFTPYSSDETVARYLAETTRGATAFGAFFQAMSALALLVLTASAADYVRRMVPEGGYASVIRSGGAVSTALLLVSSSAQWVMNRPGTGDDLRVFRAISDLVFVTGAAPHVATLGLSVGALAAAGFRTGALPRWLSWSGSVIAAASLLSMLSLLFEPATIFIPFGRYIGMLWFLALAVTFLLHRPPRDAAVGRAPLVAGR